MENLTCFTKNEFSEFKCPFCSKGHLTPFEVNSIESKASKRMHSHEDWEGDWINGSFHAVLKCSFKPCSETVIAIGKFEIGVELVDRGDGPEPDYAEFYSPRFFYPNLKLFKIPENVPENISKILDESFSLFFCNPSSAANIARTALEKILDGMKVKAYATRTGPRRRVSLHQRLNWLPPKYSSEKDLFLAIKWLGNAGSHSSSSLSHNDLLDCYKILEKLLSKIFSSEEKDLEQLVSKINKRKGPARKRKK